MCDQFGVGNLTTSQRKPQCVYPFSLVDVLPCLSSIPNTETMAATALPLHNGAKLAVLGPMAFARDDMISDYGNGHWRHQNACWNGSPAHASQSSDHCIPTIAEALAAASIKHGGTISASVGCSIDGPKQPLEWVQAITTAKSADEVVLVLGNGHQQEREGKDRKDTTLPGQQNAFALEVLKLGKPTTVVFIGTTTAGRAFPTGCAIGLSPMSCFLQVVVPLHLRASWRPIPGQWFTRSTWRLVRLHLLLLSSENQEQTAGCVSMECCAEPLQCMNPHMHVHPFRKPPSTVYRGLEYDLMLHCAMLCSKRENFQ